MCSPEERSGEMRDELRRRFERLRREEALRARERKLFEELRMAVKVKPLQPPLQRKELNPNIQERIDVLDLLIAVLREHEKSLDELIRKGSFAMETETKRLGDLLFRLEEALSRLERT